MVPHVATYEDLVGIKGKQTELLDRQPFFVASRPPLMASQPKPTVYSMSTSFLSAWKPKEKKEESAEEVSESQPQRNSVHHFCTVTNDYQLPKEFQNIGRKYHTPSKIDGTRFDTYRVSMFLFLLHRVWRF